MARGLYIISYDIADNRTRLKVAHRLEGYGERVQYSVFEVWLTERELEALRPRLAAAVEQEGSIRIYRLCAACRQEVEILGKGRLTEEMGLLFI